MKCLSKHQYFKIFVLELNKYEKFETLEVVDCGSETQPQVVGNFHKLTEQDKG